jgi:hypothetical protein
MYNPLFSQRNSPASILREFGGNTLNLFANTEGRIAITSLKRQISRYFPAKQSGNLAAAAA